MTRTSFSRTIKLTAASLLAVFFGFPGVAAANADIRHTGPDSHNVIKHSSHNSCEVKNTNNVDVNNRVSQHATSGDASVGGWSSGWGGYDPAAWQAKGYSYEQWKAAFDSYMSNSHGGWKNNWNKHHGGGNTHGGDATSGDARNHNTISTSAHIDNSGACADHGHGQPSHHHPAGHGGTISHTGPGSTNVLGVSGHGGHGGQQGHVGSGHHAGHKGSSGGHVLGTSHQPSGFSHVNHPTSSGGAGGHTGPTSKSTSGIHHTGPDSHNVIKDSSTSKTTVTNTNTVNVSNNTTQHATSGDATVAGNTKAGSATTGDASNYSAVHTGVVIHN